MKTILITGINGFFGSHLAKYLYQKYNVVGLEFSLQNLYRLKNFNFKVYSSNSNLETVFKNESIYAVIHTATIYRRNDDESIEKLIDTNVLLPVKIFEIAEKYNCKYFLNTDTFFNDHKYNYSYLADYTLSKKQVLEWIRLRQKKCKLINMKVFHMYGPSDRPSKFIPYLISQLSNNKKNLALTLGEQTRDFVYIDDVVGAFKKVIESLEENKPFFDEYEIGTGISTSIKNLVIELKSILASTTELEFGKLPYRNDEIMHSVANIKNINIIGWYPKYSVKEGLLSTTNLIDGKL